MRLPLLLGCGIVMLVSAACSSSSSTPPAEGNTTIDFSGCIYAGAEISGPGGTPTADNYGRTVLDGSTGGYHVSCSVTINGAYAVRAHIESPDISLTVDSSDISAGAQMSFFVAGSGGTQEAIVSTNSNNQAASTCTLTTSGGEYVVKSGTIFAHYDCPTVSNVTNLSTTCHASGLFYFTHCGS